MGWLVCRWLRQVVETLCGCVLVRVGGLCGVGPMGGGVEYGTVFADGIKQQLVSDTTLELRCV